MTITEHGQLNRRRLLQYFGASGAAVAVAGGLGACTGPASTTQVGGGSSTDAIDAGIAYTLNGSFDPMTATGAVTLAANMHIFEGLVDLDPVTRKPYPALAQAMPEQVDPTTLRMKIREGATFHDGSKVTTEDVAYSYQRVLDPANSSLFASFIPFVDKVTAVDDTTVEMKLKFPFALVNQRLGLVKIVPKKIVQANEKRFGSEPVGSGPFKLVKAAKGDRLAFTSWDNYNGPRPAKASKMTWRLLEDPTARVTAFKSGRVQAIESVPYIAAERLSNAGKVEAVPSFGVLFMMFNCKKPPFDDVRVRQALHYAIDKEKMIKTGLLGGAAPATGYTQTSHPEYVRASTVYNHDPAKAKKLLADAGVKGLTISVVSTTTGWVQDCAPFVKEAFDAIGVRTTLDIGESGGQYADKVATGNYQVMVAPGDPSVFGNDLDLLLRWFNYGNWPTNFSYWSETPEYRKATELMDQAVRQADKAKREQSWKQVVDLLAKEVHTYPLLHRKLPTAWKPKELQGFEPLPTTGLSFLDVGRA